MGLIDRFRRRPLEQDGRTAATAILLPAVGSGEAAAIRIEVLERLFGVRDLDWQILKRSRVEAGRGRRIERFDIGTRQAPEVVYFDLGDVAESAEVVETKAALSAAAAARPSEEDLTIDLGQDLYLTLWKILEEVADRFAGDGFAYDFVRVTVLQAMAAHDLRSAAPLAVTLRVTDWAALRAVVERVEAGDAAAQTRIEALGASIGEGLARAA
jgi:hypothetical protein